MASIGQSRKSLLLKLIHMVLAYLFNLISWPLPPHSINICHMEYVQLSKSGISPLPPCLHHAVPCAYLNISPSSIAKGVFLYELGSKPKSEVIGN